MKRVKCPRCENVVSVPEGQRPYCGRCGHGTPPSIRPATAVPVASAPASSDWQGVGPRAAPPGGSVDGFDPHLHALMNAAPKSRIVAGVLGILLGAFGVHRFYLGHIGLGILYLLFFWTYIPGIIGLVEGIIYLTQDDVLFNEKHGGDRGRRWANQVRQARGY